MSLDYSSCKSGCGHFRLLGFSQVPATLPWEGCVVHSGDYENYSLGISGCCFEVMGTHLGYYLKIRLVEGYVYQAELSERGESLRVPSGNS